MLPQGRVGPSFVHFGVGFIGINAGALLLSGSHMFLSLVQNGALRPPAVFGSGIRTLSPCDGWATPSLPPHPVASTPITVPVPIRLDPPLQKIRN